MTKLILNHLCEVTQGIFLQDSRAGHRLTGTELTYQVQGPRLNPQYVTKYINTIGNKINKAKKVESHWNFIVVSWLSQFRLREL
jgi:triphosphoribosyl-dephospho-CoA synthetase